MSTFSGLNTAYRGLVAARQGLDIVGQNIANANTEGYTRQRVTTSSVAASNLAGMFSSGVRPGEGVSVDGIARLGSEYLDARVNGTASTAGYWLARAEAMMDLEGTLREPGENALSTQLDGFWAAWQGLSNQTGEPAAARVLLEESGALASRIASSYGETIGQWSELRGRTVSMVVEVNAAAARIADLNAAIRQTTAAGGSANELVDQRATLATTISSLTGATIRPRDDGTIDVTIGGNAIVSGETARSIRVVGATRLEDAATSNLALEWTDHPGRTVSLDGGRIAGTLSLLAPASAGGGGALADLASSYNVLATSLASTVNAVHQSGARPDGTTGHDFFTFTAGVPAAQGLVVIPTNVSELSAAAPGAGGLDGSIADAIAQLRLAPGSANAFWAQAVVRTGVTTKSDAQHAVNAELASQSAVGSQRSAASVDLDEENVNLMTFQTAYQGSARVMTAIDQMLDTLINRTGIVGR